MWYGSIGFLSHTILNELIKITIMYVNMHHKLQNYLYLLQFKTDYRSNTDTKSKAK